jgi:hypothetical protein
MHAYRCYLLSGEGRFREVEVIKCVDDKEAIATAQRILAERDHYSGFEVWEGERLITFDHHGDFDHHG